METCDEKDAAVPVAQKDPRVLSSHARHGSCAGRRVDGVKLASGAVAASKRQDAALNPLPLVNTSKPPVPPGPERLVLRELDLEREPVGVPSAALPLAAVTDTRFERVTFRTGI